MIAFFTLFLLLGIVVAGLIQTVIALNEHIKAKKKEEKELIKKFLTQNYQDESKAPPERIPPPNPTVLIWKTIKSIIFHPSLYIPVGIFLLASFTPMPSEALMILGTIIAAPEIYFWSQKWPTIYKKHECSAEKTYRENYNELKARNIPKVSKKRTKIKDALVF